MKLKQATNQHKFNNIESILSTYKNFKNHICLDFTKMQLKTKNTNKQNKD